MFCTSSFVSVMQREGPNFPVSSLMLVFGCFWFSQYATSRILAGKLTWCPVREQCVRATLIVFVPQDFDQHLGFPHISEPVRIQTLGSEGSVEAFYKSIVRRLPGSREVDLNVVRLSP